MSEAPAGPLAKKPIRCLVVQITRLGDTLQSLMALRAAKQLYPQLEIHFVARERFAAAAKRVPWIENVITLPTESLLGPVLTGQKTELQALGDIARWIGPLVREPWDLLINWSYSESSSYLTGLIPARVKLGYTRRRDRSFACADGWSHYIQAIVQNEVDQNIHLTDILTTQLLTALQIHYGEPANDGDAPVTSKSFFSLEIGDRELSWCWRDLSRKWIAIQLGAGHDSKTWDPENWARLASSILTRHPEYSIVILGGKEDQARSKRFTAELMRHSVNPAHILSLVGETDFDLWASVVSGAQWLMACDTAAIHLASVLGTRVLNVSVGPVRWAETGPYGNGHYVIASQKPCAGCDAGIRTGAEPGADQPHTCRNDITPEAVYATWSYASSEWSHRRKYPITEHFGNLGVSRDLEAVEVFRARIRNTSDGGGVVYEPLHSRAAALDDWMAMVLGHIARAWYCGWVPPVGQELDRPTINPVLIKSLRELDESVKVLAKIYSEACLAALALNKKSSTLRSQKLMPVADKDAIQELGKKLMDLDNLSARLTRSQPALRAFEQMSQVLMHNLRGDALSDLGKESADCYRQLGEGLTILADWLKFTLNLAKPIAIHKTAPKEATT